MQKVQARGEEDSPAPTTAMRDVRKGDILAFGALSGVLLLADVI